MHTEHAVLFKTETGKVTSGKVRVRAWSPLDKKLRAIRVLGIAWAMGIVFVFIPLLHFILVPAFVLGGPILAYFTFAQGSTVLGGEGACPACGQRFLVERAAEKWPLADTCSSCHARVEIELLSR